MSVKNDLTSLLTQASDPTSTPEQLVTVWNSTTSPRVRKAVASNPNCDTATLCMASRLYIKEVIENPSLELNTLFSEDPVVKDIYSAYTNPGEFWDNGLKRAKVKGPVYRALLVSPHLKSWKILENLIKWLSSAEFTRELKDQGVKSRVRSIAKSGIDRFNISALVFFLNNGVLTVPEFCSTLDNRSRGEFHLPKKAYCEVFKTVRDKTDYPTLFKFVLASSNYSLKHLVKSFKDVEMEKYLVTDECLVDLSNLYKDLLVSEIYQCRENYRNNSSRYWARTSYNDSKQSYYFSQLIWEIISSRNEMAMSSLDLQKLYEDIKLAKFDTDYGPYKCRIKFKELDLLTGRNDMCRKLLDLEDDSTFEFFMTGGFLWHEWYAKGGAENLETRVMDRMHKVNETRGGRYYKYSKLSDYYPSVEIRNSNGTMHRSEVYHDAKLTEKLSGSGLVPLKQ